MSRWLVVLCVLSCTPAFDGTRVVPERGTLGEEVYRVFCARLAATELPQDVSGDQSAALCDGQDVDAPTPRLAAMDGERDRIVEAIDSVAPPALHDGLDRFLKSLVPFYDPPEEALPRQTRALAELLEAIVADDDALASLERLSQRQGYRPLRHALGVARPAMAYPRLRELTTQVLDATSAGGAAETEWRDMLVAMSLEMASAEPSDRSDGPSTLELTRNLLYQTDDRFGSGESVFLARRDRRGIVVPFGLGPVPTPFADRDGDGLADIDPLGRFVDREGLLLDLPAPFATVRSDGLPRDPSGRAIRSDGSPLYDTFDVNDTLLAGVVREAVPLLDVSEPALLDAAFSMRALLGPAARRSEDIAPGVTVDYDGFDPSESPVLDLVHGGTTLLRDPNMDDVLATVLTVLRDEPAALAALVDAGMFGREVAADYPDVALDRESDLFDDQIVVFEHVAQTPGLTEALLRALADPRSKRLGHIFGEMMRYSDEVRVDPSNINRSLENIEWTREVDTTRPESDTNRSMFQQSVAIIHDLSGVRLCNKAGAKLGLTLAGRFIELPLTFDECELLEIEDVAVTYQQAILGRARIDIKDAFVSGILEIAGVLPGFSADEVLERESGIDGLTTRPTPEALSRLVFAPRNRFLNNLIDPPLTRDGVPVEERHQGVILAWERGFRFCGDESVPLDTPCAGAEDITFIEAMTPLLAAFDDFDPRTDGSDLFSELVTAAHLHWPSRDDPNTQSSDERGNFFSYQDNGRAYEPIASALISDCTPSSTRCNPGAAGQLVSRLHRFLRIVDDIEPRPGVDGIDAMAAATEFLVDSRRHPTLVDRRGRGTSTRSSATGVLPMSPLLLLTDALAHTEEAWDDATEQRDSWRAARSRMADHFLATERLSTGVRFTNPRFWAAVEYLIEFLRERIDYHRRAGDLEDWTAEMAGNMEDSMDSAMGASLIAFLEAVQDDDESTEELSRFMTYLMSDETPEEAWRDALLAMADMMQVLEDDENMVPILRVLSEALAPGARERIAAGGRFDVRDIDTTGSLVDATTLLLRRANEVDDDNVLSILLAGLVELPAGRSETPLEALIDAAAEIHRAEPGIGTRMLRPDYEAVFDNTIEFLRDEDHGIERIYQVVQSRQLSP